MCIITYERDLSVNINNVIRYTVCMLLIGVIFGSIGLPTANAQSVSLSSEMQLQEVYQREFSGSGEGLSKPLAIASIRWSIFFYEKSKNFTVDCTFNEADVTFRIPDRLIRWIIIGEVTATCRSV